MIAEVENKFRNQISGIKFEGEIELKDNEMKLSCIQYKKGGIYQFQITDATLIKEFRRYLFFSKILDLFTALSKNKRLQITDEGTLIMPIQVIYEEKTYTIKIEMQINLVKFKRQAQEKQKLYEQLAKMKKKTQSAILALQKQFSFISKIKFKGDESNPNFCKFKLTNKGKTVIKQTQNCVSYIFNHYQHLPKTGSYFFKLKIINTVAKQILIGGCGKTAAELIQTETYTSPQFIGLHLSNGNIYMNKTNKTGTGTMAFTVNSIFKVLIDMDTKIMKWFMDQRMLCWTAFNQQMLNVDIYPMILLYNAGDSIQFENE